VADEQDAFVAFVQSVRFGTGTGANNG
jgi:hypothetical protein